MAECSHHVDATVAALASTIIQSVGRRFLVRREIEALMGSNGDLMLVPLSAGGLRDMNAMLHMDPFVVAKLPNDRISGRTLACSGGGVWPVWAAEHENVIRLPLGKNFSMEDDLVTLEVWNEKATD